MAKWICLVLPMMVFSIAACTKDHEGAAIPTNLELQAANSARIFSDGISDIQIVVFHEPTAVPYTGLIGTTANQTWDISRLSIQALFQNHVGRLVFAPLVPGQMTALPAQQKTLWTAAELLDLSHRFAPENFTDFAANLSVFVLAGRLKENATATTIHFAGQPHVFIFKEVISGLSTDPIKLRYAEQAAIIHGLGHAIGLVNSGTPMFNPHEDPNHRGHSTNANCAMHAQIENGSALLGAVSTWALSNALNLFGPESLADARTFHP